MLNLKTIFEKSYEYFVAGLAEMVRELRKDKVDIINRLDPKGVAEAIVGLQGIVKKGLADVKTSVDDKYVAEEVKITNLNEISEELSPHLVEIAKIIKSELGKIEKEVVVKNDFGSIASFFKANHDKKDLLTALSKIEGKIKPVDLVDYTSLLKTVLSTLEEWKNQKLSLPSVDEKLSQIVASLSKKHENWLEKFEEDGRIKVVLPKDFSNQIQKGMYGVSNEAQLKNKINAVINPATEDLQTTLNTLITTLNGLTQSNQELQQRLAFLGSVKQHQTESLRVTPVTSVTTTVTGTVTAGNVTNFGTAIPASEMAHDINNSTAVLANINNVTVN